MGTIKKLKNGKHKVDVRDANGNRIRKIFDNRSDAAAFISKIGMEKYKGKLAKAGLDTTPAQFEVVINEAVKGKESLAPKSLSKYKGVYTVFQKFISETSISLVSDFSRAHADSFKDVLVASGASPKTINFYLMAVKSLFKDLVLRDLIDKNPFDHVKLERLKRKNLLDRADDYYDEKEIKAFFAESMLPAYRVAFIGLFLTGLRFEEFSSLIWKRIDLEKKIIQIRSDASFTTKTVTSERDIPISDKLFNLLSDMNKFRASDYVFTSPSNTKISERTLLSVCKAVASSAGITKNATLHKWRHSFNSHLAQAGVDYTIRQYLLGHKPQTMTDHYTKVDPAKLHNQVSKLDVLINNEPTNG